MTEQAKQALQRIREIDKELNRLHVLKEGLPINNKATMQERARLGNVYRSGRN